MLKSVHSTPSPWFISHQTPFKMPQAPLPAPGGGGAAGGGGTKRRAPLHLATNVEDLTEQAKVPQRGTPEMLLKTLPKLSEAAAKALAQDPCDEETAYVLYMRYMEAFKAIRGSAKYRKDQRYFDQMMGKKTVAAVVRASETLHGSLSQRYEKMNHEKAMEKERLEQEKRDKESPHPMGVPHRARAVVLGDKKRDLGKNRIDAKGLYALLEQKSTSLLLLDCRPREDFNACRVKSAPSLNIPEELVKPGQTAKALERALPVEDRLTWKKRLTADKLILLDWFSRDFEPETYLTYLRETMVQWDLGEDYACKEPILLSGGIDAFVFTYPTMVTDSKEGKRLGKERKKATVSSSSSAPSKAVLADVSYPIFNENGVLVRPAAKLVIDPAIASGAITITRQQHQHPVIPDRASKPAFAPKQVEIPTEIFSPPPEQLAEEPRPPSVDRSTKAKYLLNQSREEGSPGGDFAGASSNLKDVQEAEKELLEDSLEREREELELERQWDLTRMRREKEAEEEMKLELLRKEEGLISRLEGMMRESEEKDFENRRLKEELEELKSRLGKEREDKAMAEALLEKEKEERKLREEIEEKRRERQKKEEEVRREMKKRAAAAAANNTNVSRSTNSSPRRAPPPQGPMVPKPKYDRTSKPSDAGRAKNLAPVYTMGPRKHGLTGLRNLGNTCYMNSVLQCLSNFTIPADYFMNKFEPDLNSGSETRGEVAREFSELLRALWGGQYRAVSPVDMKRVAGRHHPMFSGSGQQDAHEFFIILLGWLHDDVNEVKGKVTLPEAPEFGKMGEQEGAEASWQFLGRVDRSFVVSSFHGQTASTLTCRACGWRSVKYETFVELKLQLPADNSRYSVHQGIKELLWPEEVRGAN